ncbi:MAG: phosphoribosylformylglycinamidine cyclo-ligase [Candidatus Eisenbacteria bacterium]|uniref:Phosphoribosylformylglycinamidine cyclo-ligase n=1 Tax=Eiseniibacteriota bacterium TaxID=2212470 RepID=A0A933SAE4_UNCEI|nr:phosphoribosylformylglycinamidine cyclo-ligase [Candidatus Eisenbacteria bacterium]
MRYSDAGVDISRSDAIKDEVVAEIRSTWGESVRPLVGGFAGVMRYPGAAPMVAATMDGVGTKLHLAMRAGRLDDAAADLVYHGANDLLVHGAKPLAFLDYVAQAKLDPEAVLAVVRGLSRACREVGAALLGGETAEMPDTYLPEVIDVAGCMLGVVDDALLLDGSRVRAGDAVLGIAGSGLHTNGYSLARKVLAASGLALTDALPGGAGESVGEALLQPHRWYGRALLPLAAAGRVRAMAHVTGGGISGNLVRVLPEGCRAHVRMTWPEPAVFRWLREAGGVPIEDARTALNLGVGMVVVTAPGDEAGVLDNLAAAGETAWRIGEVAAGERGVEWTAP